VVKAKDANKHDYAQTASVASQKQLKWATEDPMPDIAPALLNAADIADYVHLTGMIYPFAHERIKSSAYEMILGNEVLWWDESGKHHKEKLKSGDVITLSPNSIVYVTTEENFLIPDYIALRFNLTIKHVHRGLLLGTGPLVNPGFKGKLMIPIHNLTPNTYTIPVGSPIISVEFTKISSNIAWNKNYNRETSSSYIKNPMKPGQDFEKFISGALGADANSVESSLGKTIKETEKALTDATTKYENELEKSKKRARFVQYSTLASIVIALLGILFAGYQLYQGTQSLISDSNKYVSDATMLYKDSTVLRKDISNIEGEVAAFQNELKKENAQLKATISDLKDQLIRIDTKYKIEIETLSKLLKQGTPKEDMDSQSSPNAKRQ